MTPELILGLHKPRWRWHPLGLTPQQTKTHFHVIGVSGSGKSRFLAGLFVNLIKLGYAATLIDPHGDLAALVVATLAKDGFYNDPANYDKLVYLNLPAAERAGYFVPFNVLDQPLPPHSLASNIKESMHRAWPALGRGAAPMFDTLVQDGVKVLVTNKLPLTSLYRLLTDKHFRDYLLLSEPDADIVAFFHDQFDQLPERDRIDQAGAALRRAHLLTFSPTLKYSLGQTENRLPLRQLLDSNRSLIVNLALGDGEARRLLGCLLTVSAEQAALSRADTPEKDRKYTNHLIIDEFSEFTAQSEEALSRMLSLTRKYGLFLVMAHQTYSQASERFQGALQNVGVSVAFRLGREDAEIAVKNLSRLDPRQLSTRHGEETEGVGMREQWEEAVQEMQDLRPRHALIRKELLPAKWPWSYWIKRPTTKVYHVKTLPMPDPELPEGSMEAIEAEYRRRYFRKQSDIEADLAKAREMGPTIVRRRNLT